MKSNSLVSTNKKRTKKNNNSGFERWYNGKRDIMTVRGTWKKKERKILPYFGAERSFLSGGNGKLSRSDSLHLKLFIELRFCKRHFVVKLWDETKRIVDKEG